MNYLYAFGFPPEEEAFCRLEQRMLFGKDCGSDWNYLISDVEVPVARSPFIRFRLDVLVEALSEEELVAFASTHSIAGQTFKVVSLNEKPLGAQPKITLNERRALEMAVGSVIDGEPELFTPQLELGVVKIEGKYYLGQMHTSESVWLKHIDRPVPYSTALSAKHARALVNITAPKLDGVRVIDPCCGVGTVVIEALSMGANMLGRDMNWFVAGGSRKNLAHFGYEGTIELGPIEEVTEHYDAAIIDMPYNLFTHSTDVNKQSIIRNARRIADRVVFVSSEDLHAEIVAAGFDVVDGCIVTKQKFHRNVYVCNA